LNEEGYVAECKNDDEVSRRSYDVDAHDDCKENRDLKEFFLDERVFVLDLAKSWVRITEAETYVKCNYEKANLSTVTKSLRQFHLTFTCCCRFICTVQSRKCFILGLLVHNEEDKN